MRSTLFLALTVGLFLSCVQDGIGAVPLNDDRRAAAELAEVVWEENLLPPLTTKCEDPLGEAFVAYVGDDILEAKCVGKDSCQREGVEGNCVNACYTNTTTGCMSAGATLVIHRNLQNNTGIFIHELMHHFQGCSGLSPDFNHEDVKIWQEMVPELTEEIGHELL